MIVVSLWGIMCMDHIVYIGIKSGGCGGISFGKGDVIMGSEGLMSPRIHVDCGRMSMTWKYPCAPTQVNS